MKKINRRSFLKSTLAMAFIYLVPNQAMALKSKTHTKKILSKTIWIISHEDL
jgi:hypothetical protein